VTEDRNPAREAIRRLAVEADASELPALVGLFAEAHALAFARLAVRHSEQPVPAVAEASEELLTPAQAATAIGGVSLKWLYRHTRGLRFRRDLSRKVVRFERAGLLRWIAARRA